MGKYNPYKDPRSNEAFPKRNGKLSAAKFDSTVKYIWDQWNRSRQKLNLVRVDPPARLLVDSTTFRPPKMRGSDRPDNASVTFSYWKNNHFGKESPMDRALIRQGENAGNDLVRELEGAEAQEIDQDE